jgi:peptide/nickel transport system permease protein
MHTYIIRRILQAIPVIIVASFVIFILMHLVPGDPAQMLAGPNAPPEVVDALRERMNLDKPLVIQYFSWLANIFKGNMGKSMISGMSVNFLIGLALPATLQLTIAVLVLSIAIAIPLGILGAVRNKKPIDYVINTYLGLSLALPNFWLGILLILVFSVQLRVMPSSGYVPLLENPLQSLYFLVLPAIALGNRLTAEITRFVKNSVMDTFREDYIRTAKAKGLSHRKIVYKHVLRNALIPIITMIGMRFGRLLGGAVVVETVFSWPGIGRLIVQAIGNRDYPLVQGSLLIVMIMFILVNLVTDVLYGVIDPRISLESEGT